MGAPGPAHLGTGDSTNPTRPVCTQHNCRVPHVSILRRGKARTQTHSQRSTNSPCPILRLFLAKGGKPQAQTHSPTNREPSSNTTSPCTLSMMISFPRNLHRSAAIAALLAAALSAALSAQQPTQPSPDVRTLADPAPRAVRRSPAPPRRPRRSRPRADPQAPRHNGERPRHRRPSRR